MTASFHRPPFQYRTLGHFAFHLLTDPAAIKALLLRWTMREWELDHHAAPDEVWTVEWMRWLPCMEFSLEVLPLAEIRPRLDLMQHATPSYSFRASLQRRADEREEALQRGVSIEPLLVRADGLELMDGYTRYTVLQRFCQRDVVEHSRDQTIGRSPERTCSCDAR